MRKGLSVFVGGVLVVGLLIGGCGGDDGGGGDPEAFARQGNAICLKSNKEAGSEILAAYGSPKVKEAATERESINLEVNLFVPILMKDAEAQVDGISSLEAPSEDEDQIKAILAAYDEWLEKAKVTPLQVVIASDIFNDARKLSRKYGLVKCADTPYEEPYVHN